MSRLDNRAATFDHHFSSQNGKVSVNGKISDAQLAFVPFNDRAFMYGDGVYTSLKIQTGQPIVLDRHLARLQHNADALHFGITVSSLGIKDSLEALIQANQVIDGVARITLSRGTHFTPADPRSVDPLVVIIAYSVSLGVPLPAKVISLPECRDSLRHLKTVNRLENIQAAMLAYSHACSEAIFMDADGIVEGTCNNVIVEIGGKLVTPFMDSRGLQGITRSRLIDAGLVTEDTVAFSDKNPAFLINSLSGVIPVVEWDGQNLPVSSKIAEIRDVLSRPC